LLSMLLLPKLATQVAELASTLRDPAKLTAVLDRLGSFAPMAHRAAARLGPALADATPSIAQGAAQLVAEVGRHVAHYAFFLFLLAVALYYLYLDGEKWRERLVQLAPLPDEDVRAFLHQFQRVSVGVLVGSLGTALVQGVLSGVGYLALGVPMALMWA